MDREKNEIIINCGYRIHINSLDMNGFSGRCCGGLGFSLNDPMLELKVKISTYDMFIGKYPEKIEKYVNRVRENYNIPYKFEISVSNEATAHTGLGSESQLCYAIATAILTLCDIKLDYIDISQKLGLAGVSGIGYGAFTKGGFIIDGGYILGENKKNFVEHSKTPPTFLYHRKVDENWKVVVVIPKDCVSISQEVEDMFFAKYTPVPIDEVKEITYYTLMGIMPAIKENNFEQFISSMKIITKLGTKKAELAINEENCKEILSKMEELFGFSALSSLGPACYSFVDTSKCNININKEYLTQIFPNSDIYITNVRNTPYEITTQSDTVSYYEESNIV